MTDWIKCPGISRNSGIVLALMLAVGGCSPTVKLQAPDEPIRFDVNVNITEEKRLQIDKELLQLIRRNPALFGLTEDDLSGSTDNAR